MSQIIITAENSSSLVTPVAGKAKLIFDSILKTLMSIDDTGSKTIYGAGGTFDHSAMLNLDFAGSGHTGFEITGGGTAAVLAHDLLYNHSDINLNTTARHSAVTLGISNGLSLSGQELSLGLSSAVSTGAVSPIDFNIFNNKEPSLIPTAIISAGYSASISQLICVSLATSSVLVELPSTPQDRSIIELIIKEAGVTNTLEIKTSGADVFSVVGGQTSIYESLYLTNIKLRYQLSNNVWHTCITAAPRNFSNNNTGIDAQTPINDTHISFDAVTTLQLTITPPLGYMNIITDGLGKSNRFRKTSSITFPAITNTSGIWYFYFDVNGNPVTTQTAWTTQDFPFIVTVYRILWNSTLAGAARNVAQYIEYHLNDIDPDTHQWFHLNGAIWGGGLGNFDIKSNVLASGSPNSDGRNTVVAVTTGTNVDDNLEYTVTNSVAGTRWTQDLGELTPASLTSSNSALFKVFNQDVSGNVSFLPATRFPFPFNGGTNLPEYITASGVRTTMTSTNFLPIFIYATQNPVAGEQLKLVTYILDQTSIANARAINWTDIQSTYLIIGNDNEVRPLYRLIIEHRASYDIGCKKAVLREVQDLRRSAVTTFATATGSIPASSVTFVPFGSIAATNMQSVAEELSTEKVQLLGTAGGQTITGDTITNGSLNLRGNAADLTSGQCNFIGTKEVTSLATAAVVCSGGLAVVKSLITGGTKTIIGGSSTDCPIKFSLTNIAQGIYVTNPDDVNNMAVTIMAAASKYININKLGVKINGQTQSATSTVTVPAYSNSADTNTGLHVLSPDILSLVTGGAERVYCNANGQVGVGISTFDGTNPEALQIYQNHVSSINAISARGSVANYLQINVKNLSNGASGSSDLCATANTGTELINYIDAGINDSVYSDPLYSATGPLDSYLIANGGHLAIITATSSMAISIYTGGTTSDKKRATFSDTIATIETALTVKGNTTLGDASTDTITNVGRCIFRTTASDPQDATPGNRPAGTVAEMAYYSGKMYFCTNASTPLWEKITSV